LKVFARESYFKVISSSVDPTMTQERVSSELLMKLHWPATLSTEAYLRFPANVLLKEYISKIAELVPCTMRKASSFLEVMKSLPLKGRLMRTDWLMAGGVARVRLGETVTPVLLIS
jgi:hypothetical protein